MGVLRRWTGTEWEIVGRNPPEVNVVDLSAASTDYLLAVGETAFIDYVNATSVPLRVATQEGIYDLKLVNASVGVTDYGSVGNIALKPNNVLVPAGSINWSRTLQVGTSVTSAEDTGNQTAFVIALDKTGIVSECTIFTYKTRKVVRGYMFVKTNADQFGQYLYHQPWVDTVTPWVSLGTMIFPVAQSGKIVIKRVI